jgi:hypothetical protein
MKIKDLSKALSSTFLRGIAAQGFVEIDNKCIYVRRMNDLLHVAVVEPSRHGPRFRVLLYPWVAEFATKDLVAAKNESQLLLSHWTQETALGHYTIGTAKWWPCDSTSSAAESGVSMVDSFLRGAVPWFNSIRSKQDVLALLISSTPIEVVEGIRSDATTLPSVLEKIPNWP